MVDFEPHPQCHFTPILQCANIPSYCLNH